MRVGILGCGQLGRMLALAGYPLGLAFSFFGQKPHSATQELGRFCALRAEDDGVALRKHLIDCDAVTFETENTPVELALAIEQYCPVYPTSQVLSIAQNRFKEKQLFNQLAIPTPRYFAIENQHQLEDVTKKLGFPFVLKTMTMGYDGKGQVLVSKKEHLKQAENLLSENGACIAEAWIPFVRELSVIGVRSLTGEMLFYPLTENFHQAGILRYSIAPAEQSTLQQSIAEGYLRQLMSHFNYVGVLVLELFETTDGCLLANEIAPRVHNSGHWTQDGASTSQFENHLRAILGWPLGDIQSCHKTVMINLLGRVPAMEDCLRFDGHVHLYQKDPKPDRKLGHINYCFDDTLQATRFIQEKMLPDE